MVELNDSELKRLIELAKQQTIEIPKISTQHILNRYLETRKLASYSVDFYKNRMKSFIAKFPIFPIDPLLIDEYVANLTYNNNPSKPASYKTRINTLATIKQLIKFASINFNLPDISKRLTTPHKPQVEEEHPILTPEDLVNFVNRLQGQPKLILLTLIDSGCRIGELCFTKDHPGLTVDRVLPDQEKIIVYGKTGMHKMHCSREFCEALIQNASPSGAIFHTYRHPEGIRDHSTESHFQQLITKYLPQLKTKRGAHTIRHSIGSLIADLTGQPLAVQRFLKHATVTMSMKYIHESEERKDKSFSPLKVIGQQVSRTTPHKQTLLISESTETSTALTIANPTDDQIEKVEAVPDLSEDMFQQVPEFSPGKEPRPRLHAEDLKLFRKACVYYARTANPTDPIPGKLSRLFNRILQKQ